MKNSVLKLSLFVIAVTFCSCEAEDNQAIEEYNSRMLSAFIYDSDIVGEWDLTAIYADNPVDLNGDGKLNNNLISETSCFDPVRIKFKGDKTFSSLTSRLENKEDGILCKEAFSENGIWSLKNNTITFYVARNGTMVKYERQITLTEDSFRFEVNPVESEEYINNENTTSGIFIAALEYSISE